MVCIVIFSGCCGPPRAHSLLSECWLWQQYRRDTAMQGSSHTSISHCEKVWASFPGKATGGRPDLSNVWGQVPPPTAWEQEKLWQNMDVWLYLKYCTCLDSLTVCTDRGRSSPWLCVGHFLLVNVASWHSGRIDHVQLDAAVHYFPLEHFQIDAAWCVRLLFIKTDMRQRCLLGSLTKQYFKNVPIWNGTRYFWQIK